VPIRGSDSDIEGQLVFRLDPRGEAVLETEPNVAGSTGQFINGRAMAATLLPRLPGKAVGVGDRWLDTIYVEASEEASRVEGHSIIQHTVMSDTLLGGRRIVRVSLEGEDHRRIEATQAGMSVSQTLDGRGEGLVLWDPGARAVVEYRYGSELNGTMEMSAMSFPLTVHVRSESVLVLETAPDRAR
jgi:hypothetical protein